ncbi:MAG: hypothetical protein ACOY3E_03965 [Pseudomonadota bacterium]
MAGKERGESQRALLALGYAMLVGAGSLPLYALTGPGWLSAVEYLAVGLLLAGAALLAGGILGFLFGIPRTQQQDDSNAAVEPGTTSKDNHRIDYRANTNLEQISDWLTKILVGVGLTQLSEIEQGFAALTAAAARGFGGAAHSQIFAGALLAYFTILGFLFGYLWTRLFMAGALRMADQAAIGALMQRVQQATEKAEGTERKLDALQQQAARDAEALALMHRQLNPSPDLPEITQTQLDQAVLQASRPVRVQIFNQAWQVRSENWRDPASKAKMARTIPLLRALIHSDSEKRFHMNHGQLGFALKDKEPPDWAQAEQELSTAIAIRGPWQEKGWLFYELNRAICRIMLDAEFQQGQASSEPNRERILADLRAASHASDLQKIIMDDPVIRQWRSYNKISSKQLRASDNP